MSEHHPTAPAKPSKPYADFPLFPHAAGVWAKKIRGKMHYFGPWADPDAALAKYLEQKDALHAGRKPREATAGVTVKELANRFLNAKHQLVVGGELSPRTWTDYKEASDLVLSDFGKARLLADVDQGDFSALRNRLAKKWGPFRLGKVIQCIRCLFKFAYDAEMVAAPVRFGPGFKRPSKKTLRLHKAKQGTKLYTADESRRLINAASLQLKAMILLGVNCGFGNGDCATLPIAALDLDAGWIDFPRPKTGISRRCPLWAETVAALRAALAKRPQPKTEADAGLVFVTKYGDPWGKGVADSPITKETRKLLDKLGIDGHRNFYNLRHVFRTVADGAKDQPAADHIMGHEVAHMSSVYREGIADERLKAVADHVRAWLFAAPAEPPPAEAAAAGLP
jgi:integrase